MSPSATRSPTRLSMSSTVPTRWRRDSLRRSSPGCAAGCTPASLPLALAAGIVLVVLAPTTAAPVAGAVFRPRRCCCSAPAGSTTAATGARAEAHPARLDHANIYVFIAGSYTPLALLLLPEGQARALLLLIWGGASAAMLFRMFWLGAPRWLYTALYIVMGWAALGWTARLLRQRRRRGVRPDPGRRALLHGRRRGLRRKRPNPSPALVRLPRDLPRLHDRGVRLPLRGDLDHGLRR